MTQDGPQQNVVPLLEMLLRRRRRLALAACSLAVLAVVVGLLWPRSYTASAAFTPQSSESPLSRLAGLAAQFGVVGVPGQDQTLSPDFYADLVRSEQLRRALVVSQYWVPDGADTVRGTLVDFYGIHKQTPELSREAAVKRLENDLSVSVGLRTGIIQLETSARSPELALQLVQRTLELLNEFNLQSRQTQAAAERRFAETSAAHAEELLRASEDRMQSFLQQNRNYSNSPQLNFEHDRLQRDVDTRQQVFTTLAQSLEQAKIEEVRNTPVITVVERPILPVKPDSRFLAFKVLAAFLVGAFGAICWTLLEDYFDRSRRADPAGTDRFLSVWRETRAELRRPWRLFRGRSA